MKKLMETLGTVFIIGSVVFLLVHSFLVTGGPGENFFRDLFGLPIPTPPVWTSFIPIFGVVLDVIFQYFSLHGLVGVLIAGTLFSIGGYLINLGGRFTAHPKTNVRKETNA